MNGMVRQLYREYTVFVYHVQFYYSRYNSYLCRLIIEFFHYSSR